RSGNYGSAEGRQIDLKSLAVPASARDSPSSATNSQAVRPNRDKEIFTGCPLNVQFRNIRTLDRRIAMARVLRLVAIVTLLFSFALPVSAQSGNSSIAGVVSDASGARLPGVTVEVSSPALIEKTRVVVTDGEGAYKVLDLRPGTYAVTFTLTGFATVKRDAIQLPASFTA